jgi:hypothetical protein
VNLVYTEEAERFIAHENAQWRILMPKTAHHVYFIYWPETETIEVVSLSGGRRKEGPSFQR